MAVDMRFVEQNRNLTTTQTLVSLSAFDSRNGGLSKEYLEGRNALEVQTGAPMPERFLDYAASLTPSNNPGHPETLTHQLSGALSQLSVTELGQLANVIEQRASAAGDLSALIEESQALRCLPAPLLAAAIPATIENGAFGYSVQFGRHIAGVTRIDDGTKREFGSDTESVGVVVTEHNNGMRSENERFLNGVGEYSRDARTPVSYVLVASAQWNESTMGPIKDFLIAQRSLGTRTDKLVAVVSRYTRLDGLGSKLRERLDLDSELTTAEQIKPEIAQAMSHAHGPAAVQMAVELGPDLLAQQVERGHGIQPFTKSVLELFGKPLIPFEYPPQLVTRTREALAREAQQAAEPVAERRGVDPRRTATAPARHAGGPLR